MNSDTNQRIAKNTLMLYVRMLLIMAVSLYTSRIVLNTLGVTDFGIYNVVGGFISILAFINSSMASATQRFLSFELGRQDHIQLAKVFNMSINIHFVIAFIILMLAESIGIWFVNTQLIIPSERIEAAKWVYQFSVLTFLVSVVSVPYNAAIIAHERMSIYAWVSIIEVLLKLFIVFMLQWFGFDKLVVYAVLVFIISLIIRIIYYIYCERNFLECKFNLYWDKNLFNTLFNYASWNLWGNTAAALYGQGINILLNIFFGPIVNAARGIAYQIKGAVNGFVYNFQLAINPQIIKSFAAGDMKYMHQLIFQGAKFSFFLLFACTLPILMEIEIILKLWLKVVPEHTVIFTKLVIVNILIDSISGPLMTAAQASGRIKLYQGVVGGLLILILPLSYLFLKLGYKPEVTLYISIVMSIVALFARLRIISPLVDLSISKYVSEVILKILFVIIPSVIFSIILKKYLLDNRLAPLFICVGSLIIVCISIYFLGVGKAERSLLNKKLMLLFSIIKFK